MANFKYIKTAFTDKVSTAVVRGHNKKFTVTLNPQTHQYDPEGEVYYFKYDVEKEKQGNMQKRFGTSFCSYLAHKFGGNLVEDVPGSAVVMGAEKEEYAVRLDGVFSRSYKSDYRIHRTFTLDSVLRPQNGETFEYNNKHRVFNSVENTMRRLREYVQQKMTDFKNDSKMSSYNPYLRLADLEGDLAKIEEDLVSIVMLDYLFLNNDRHTENIEFSVVIDKNHQYHIVVSPVFDNDRTFGLDKREDEIEECLQSSSKRMIYTDLRNDMKFVIRDKDCEDEFASYMNFSSNYHSDVISEYVKHQCIGANGQLDIKKLKSNNLYKLFESYKDVDIKQEFYSFLCQVAGIPKVDVSNFTKAEESEFLQNFNRITGSTITLNHVEEIVQNFNIRRSLLTKSMSQMMATSTSVPIA